jgi:shikimate kinase
VAETRLGSPIALVGIAGSGKSAVARRLASRLGGTCVSLDARIMEAAGHSIAELFAREGESAFREREVSALATAVSEGPAVIDCGGGVVVEARNRAVLKQRCRTVWLEISAEEALRRIGSGVEARPLLAVDQPQTALERQLEDRADYYKEVALWRVPTGGRNPGEVVGDILQRIEGSA